MSWLAPSSWSTAVPGMSLLSHSDQFSEALAKVGMACLDATNFVGLANEVVGVRRTSLLENDDAKEKDVLRLGPSEVVLPSESPSNGALNTSSAGTIGRNGYTLLQRGRSRRGFGNEIQRVLPLLGTSSGPTVFSGPAPLNPSSSDSQISPSFMPPSPSIGGYWFGSAHHPEVRGLLRSLKMWWIGFVIWQVRFVRNLLGSRGRDEARAMNEDERRELRAATTSVLWGILGRMSPPRSSDRHAEDSRLPVDVARGIDNEEDDDDEYVPDLGHDTSESGWTTDDSDEGDDTRRSVTSTNSSVDRSPHVANAPRFAIPSRETTPFDNELPDASELGALISDLSLSEASALLARLSSPGHRHDVPTSPPRALTRSGYSLLSSTLALRQARRPPSEQENDPLRFNCVICTVEPRVVIFWPCRCLALCDECRSGLAARSSSGKHTCPCCRQTVEGYSRIFIP
ncbi:uncharacterized protein EI90DRAFT_937241 [Cantharellus anzutake]|uniref:uncharacterized protein n=1 Tax=Cantharellus anzutake TaxID=1750568 RepID=UPI0019061DBA|nr:uncharacterized protein EI90DRAFT_937241 [Cantharellus anzutake]KAF8311681.1 hypothetical protein EI90DRAFT_937241 [Cantharellus anzutake]